MRCDRCCARALTLWALIRDDDTDAELTLCGHHGDRAAEVLVASGWALIADERDPTPITMTPTP